MWQVFGSSLIKWFGEVVSAYLELRKQCGMAQLEGLQLCAALFMRPQLYYMEILIGLLEVFLADFLPEWVILDRTRRKTPYLMIYLRKFYPGTLHYSVAYTNLPSVVLEGVAHEHYYQEARSIRDDLPYFLPKPKPN